METSKLIYIKSKEHFLKGNQYWIHNIDFLKKILNIDIFSFIVISLEQITFNVLSQSNPNNLLFKYTYKLNSYSENSIKTFVTLIKKIVSGLEFDKLIGVFISKIAKSPKPLFFDEFGIDYIDKNNCIVCFEQTISKLKCNHFCCNFCFNNNLSNKVCTSCIKKSSCQINQFQYYSFEKKELKCIKKWIHSNNFFPNIHFNLTNQFNNNNNPTDWENSSGEEDYSEDEDDDGDGDEDEDEDDDVEEDEDEDEDEEDDGDGDEDEDEDDDVEEDEDEDEDEEEDEDGDEYEDVDEVEVVEIVEQVLQVEDNNW
jgi:hypothetical protein